MSTSELNSINDEDANVVGNTGRKQFWFCVFFFSSLISLKKSSSSATKRFNKIQFVLFFVQRSSKQWSDELLKIFLGPKVCRRVHCCHRKIMKNHWNSIRVERKNKEKNNNIVQHLKRGGTFRKCFFPYSNNGNVCRVNWCSRPLRKNDACESWVHEYLFINKIKLWIVATL